ncbi:MAG: hypothetical protein HY293_08005 [Planctomycetes bacterium]|nr:hypothetical protein [Planctomycetota bacterium]
MIHAIVKLLQALGIPMWVVWAVLGPLAVLGYAIAVREWFRFLGDLRRTTAAYGGRGLLGALVLKPGVRFSIDGAAAFFAYSAWTGATTLEFRIAPAGRVWIRTRGFSDREQRRFRGELVVTEDPPFEASFSVLGAPARFASEWLDTDVRHHVTTLQEVALASLDRKRKDTLGLEKLPNPRVELALDAKGLRIRLEGRPEGKEIERVLRAAGEVAKRAAGVRREAGRP